MAGVEPNSPAPSGAGAGHLAVLAAEVLEVLGPREGETYIDCTAGLGGHAAAIARRLGPTGTVVLCDLDPGNLARAEERLREHGGVARVVTLAGNFADVARRVAAEGLRGDMVLADLGFSSNQMSMAERGFSFMRDGPLDMRLDPSGPVTAAQIVASAGERELTEIIAEFGEERLARRIAQKLIEERARQPITTTARLAAIVRSVVGTHGKGGTASIDPATRTFQALRIAVNDELGNLHTLLETIRRVARALKLSDSPGAWLRPGARAAIIAFHSLEDRPVKQAFAELVDQGLAAALTRKPVTATDAEVSVNPRARSAKLRAIRVAGTMPATR